MTNEQPKVVPPGPDGDLNQDQPARYGFENGVLKLEINLKACHPFFAEGMLAHMSRLVQGWYAKQAKENAPKIHMPGPFAGARQAMSKFVAGLTR